MRHLAALALTLWLSLVAPLGAVAQTAATLVADSVQVTGSSTLIADGNVEVYFEGTRLSAARIIYDQATDRLIIDGPIFIRASDGTILTADSAELDPRLQNGILLSARLVLAEQLQLAANRIDRSQGQYTQLYKVAATSCTVCSGRPPLWDIRAERVIHDQAAQQLYFEKAQFRVRGVPIFYLPAMRLPDPTLTRATGLLIPNYRSTNLLGLGVRIPYFIRIGDSRDLTLTPYISGRTNTLEARYRQAYLRGDLDILVAGSRDKIMPGELRGYVNATASFRLANDYLLGIHVESTTDAGYLTDYGYGSGERLASTISLSRYRSNEAITGKVSVFQGLLPTASSDSEPPLVTSLRYDRTLYPDGLGGQLRYGASLDAHTRFDATSGTERDVARIGAEGQWTRGYVLSRGLVLDLTTGLSIDGYRTWQDASYDDFAVRGTPEVGAVLRWPLARVSSGTVTQVLEPVLALGWSRTFGADTANEDSTRPALDEGNLLGLSHFPGEDRTDQGLRLAYGVNWSRLEANEWEAHLTFGRLMRQTRETEATTSSGLNGMASDYLLAGRIAFPSGLSLDGRTLINDVGFPNKSAIRIDWQSSKLDLSAGYVLLAADPDEDRDGAISEWTLNADYRINTIWGVGLNGRYDVAAREPAEAGMAIRWQNECVAVELSASRRYISSTNVAPTTDFGLKVGLSGFSAGRSGVVTRRSCTN